MNEHRNFNTIHRQRTDGAFSGIAGGREPSALLTRLQMQRLRYQLSLKESLLRQWQKKGELEQVALSQQGEIFTFTVIHQSAFWVQVPYIAAKQTKVKT